MKQRYFANKIFQIFQINRMDDIPTFTAFVQNILGVAVARACTELIAYIPTFRRLMTISEEDIDRFISQVHSSNSGRAAAQRIHQ